MTKESKKIWINNHNAQAMIIVGFGFAFLFTGRTGDISWLIGIPFGMLIGIFARGFKPE